MNAHGYGLWALAVVNSLLFIVFAASFFHPATTGPYARVRHPQYLGFILIMVGFLLQWPTFATLAMFPVLLVVYRRLATREERDVRAEFCAAYDAYAFATPRFLPRVRDLAGGSSDAPQAGGLTR